MLLVLPALALLALLLLALLLLALLKLLAIGPLPRLHWVGASGTDLLPPPLVSRYVVIVGRSGGRGATMTSTRFDSA